MTWSAWIVFLAVCDFCTWWCSHYLFMDLVFLWFTVVYEVIHLWCCDLKLWSVIQALYGLQTVMCPESYVDFSIIYIYISFARFYFFPYLFTSLLICFFQNRPFHFPARCHKRQLNLALVFLYLFCVVVYCYGCMFSFVMFDSVYQY